MSILKKTPLGNCTKVLEMRLPQKVDTKTKHTTQVDLPKIESFGIVEAASWEGLWMLWIPDVFHSFAPNSTKENLFLCFI